MLGAGVFFDTIIYMSLHGTIKRYILELEMIHRRHYPSFNDIKAFLFENGFEISDRTLQRDFEVIRYEFGVEVKYDRKHRGYYVDESAGVDLDLFFRFLSLAETAELVRESLANPKKMTGYVMLDRSVESKGAEYIKPLLRAIMQHRRVRFLHTKFQGGKERHYNLKPYLLREYQNRWYLVGKIAGKHTYWHFGLDRIQHLEVLTETFEPDPDFRPAEIYDHIIGVSYHSGRKPEKVVLEFTENQGEYVKTLPLHPSQVILNEDETANPSFGEGEKVNNEQDLRIALYVIPNYELEEQILRHGEKVKVLEPQWLADRIKQRLKEALGRYD